MNSFFSQKENAGTNLLSFQFFHVQNPEKIGCERLVEKELDKCLLVKTLHYKNFNVIKTELNRSLKNLSKLLWYYRYNFTTGLPFDLFRNGLPKIK